MHVAEILRDAGPRVILYPTINSKLYQPLLYRENMWKWKSPSPPKPITENWVGMKENILLSINNVPQLVWEATWGRIIYSPRVSPDVFANNRLSSVLDTGKSVEELLAKLVLSFLVYSDK